MPVDERLLEILACPVCKTAVTEVRDAAGEWLHCAACGRSYPVRDNVPVMLIDEARSGQPGA